jgi:aminoglycoside phosphotransferase (APT) family kinase protein
VHGDFHYGNLLYREGRVVAVIDWEIAEIGQPLMDLAALSLVALRRRFRSEVNPGGMLEVGVEELLEMAGVEPEEIRWYLAATCFKYSAILGYNLGLHRRGRRPDPVYEELLPTITGLIEIGLEYMPAG